MVARSMWIEISAMAVRFGPDLQGRSTVCPEDLRDLTRLRHQPSRRSRSGSAASRWATDFGASSAVTSNVAQTGRFLPREIERGALGSQAVTCGRDRPSGPPTTAYGVLPAPAQAHHPNKSRLPDVLIHFAFVQCGCLVCLLVCGRSARCRSSSPAAPWMLDCHGASR